MFRKLEDIHTRPDPFSVYTAQALWADEYRSQQMLQFHLNGAIDVSSRNTPFLEKSSEWIIDRFGLGPGESVCDFGCGPGLYTSRFARSGAQVTGIDFSANSISYAREQSQRAGIKIDYVHGDYLDFQANAQFDLITMIMCDFCALSPTQRRKLLTIWHDSLNDNGAILLDVYSMAAYAARQETSFYEKNQLGHFWHAEDYYAFVNTFKYEPEAVILDKYSVFPEHGAAETVYNWLQYFTPDSLTEELARAGFMVEHILGDVSGGDFGDQCPEFAIVASKGRQLQVET